MIPAAGAPVERPVTIRWNQHHVPFIEATSDRDLAVALGMVHAHLRLAQIELFRRLAYGRVSEMIGPLGVEADQLLRALDFGRAVPAILQAMPMSTRRWLDGFVAGLNHYLLNCPELPPEFGLFALRRDDWTAADVLTVGRLVSADVNWIVYSQLMKFHGDRDWSAIWHNLLTADAMALWTQPVAAGRRATAFSAAGAALRSGSNSLVIGPQRSATGAALIASDPHLSLTLPGPWLIAAMHSPSYHAVGLMLPGIPFIALGRNESIAWGGTSLHAASSDLMSVPECSTTSIGSRNETIAVRWQHSRTLQVRESTWGPIVSDSGLFSASDETLALRWMGHRASDEVSAMLAVNRARSWEEFRDALDGFALPGQTMLYADTSGRLGRMMAVHLPRRGREPPGDMITAPAESDAWDTVLTGGKLSRVVDPAEGFLASANERPASDAVLIGYHFSPPDRKQRLDQLLGSCEHWTTEKVSGVLQDVHSAAALTSCRWLLDWIAALGRQPGRVRAFVVTLTNWDGNYHAGSRGALAYELLFYQLARRLISARRRAAYDAAWGTRRLVWQDIRSCDPELRQRHLQVALRVAASGLRARETWGDRHRLRLAHMVAVAPLAGRAWHFRDLPASGSSDTLHKTAHPLTDKRHGSRYGSGARHISDLSDLDHNYFVLIGGQDGWMRSTTLLDQASLWRRGEYVTVPLRPETARATFPFRTQLTP